MNINQNLNNLMKEAQKMQERMQTAQEELTKLIVVGEAGGGRVKVRMNGRHDTLDVTINPVLIDKDEIEMLQDLITAANNDANLKIEKISKDKISQLTKGLNIPTDFMQQGGSQEE